MVDLFLYNNPNVILPLETRLTINLLESAEIRRSGNTKEKEQVGRSRKSASDTIEMAMN